MAGEGVRLVERLRLGERPAAEDLDLASGILTLRDAAAGFVAAAGDLVEDRAKASKWLRFEVRVGLLVRAASRLEAAAEVTLDLMADYFALRAEDEGEEEPTDEVREEAASREAPPESIVNELSAAFESGGIAESDAGPIGGVGETIRLDSAWFVTSLADLLMNEPEIDAALDLCGEIEARFAPATFEVMGAGPTGKFSVALAGALDQAAARR